MTRMLPFAAATTALVWQVSAQDLADEKAANWHHWRGPNANGVATVPDPPLEWGEKENVKWKVELPGKGSATPIVWKGRIYVPTAVPVAKASGDIEEPAPSREGRRRGRPMSVSPKSPYQFVILCLELETGNKIWERVAAEALPHEGHHHTGTFASGSPITDGKHLFATFGSRGIYCYDMEGALKWKRDLGDMSTRMQFGEGASPALCGDKLIVPWDHEGQSFVAALDKATGAIAWKVDRDEGTTWSTPLVAEQGGRQQVVLHGSTRVRSYDPEDGSLIWECGGQAMNPVASPVEADGLVYCTTGRRGYAISALPLASTGDITDSDKIAWHRTDSGAYVCSPVVYKGLVYHVKETSGILSCLDAKTGKIVFGPDRLPGMGTVYASLVAAADRVYVTDRSGTTLVLKHGRKLEVLATNELDEGADASLVMVGKKILIRGTQHLYCIGE